VRGVARLLPSGQGHDALPHVGGNRGFASGPDRVLQQPNAALHRQTIWGNLH
jgi:hypothetical protein